MAKFEKYKEIIIYLIVGCMAAIVSSSCKFIFNIIVYEGAIEHNTTQTIVLTLVNWLSGVIFAYPMNRKFVFKSHNKILSECMTFVGSRFATLILDGVIMFILDTLLNINFYIATFISLVIVTVSNYILSKLWIFKTKEHL